MKYNQNNCRMNNITKHLRTLGLFTLYVFFYAYGIGNASPIGRYYLIFIYIAIAIAAIIFLLEPACIKKYKQYYLWMGCFIALEIATLIYALNTSHGLSWVISSFKILVKIVAVVIICDNLGGFYKLCKGLAFIGGAEFITLYRTNKLYENWRLGTKLLGNANSFALIIMFFSLGTLISLFIEKKKFLKIIYLVLFVLDTYMIFLSGGRKFLLFQLMFIYSSLLLRSGKINWKNIIMGTFIVGGIVYISYKVIMNVPVLYDHIGIRLSGLGSEEGAMGVDDQSTLMLRGISLFLQRPFFGWGIGSYVAYHGENYGSFSYAHSNYVELLADFGIFGTLLYYSQYFYCLKILFRNRNKNIDNGKVFIPIILSIIVIDIFSITFNQTAFIPFLLMFVSGIVFIEQDEERTFDETQTNKPIAKPGYKYIK